MKAVLLRSCLVLCGLVCMASSSSAQPPVGALAVDERQGDRYGWAVDYSTASAARAAALGECGPGCSAVLTFERCAAYAADQDAASTAVGWAESYGSAAGARGAALSACGSRGGSGCIVRVWGCNGPVVEEGLGLDRSARREIQEGLAAQGFDPGGADGLFGARTRAAIGGWQSYRGARATGYLDGASAAALRPSGAAPRTFRERPAGVAVPAGQQSASPGQRPAPAAAPAASAELEGLFWQSMMNSTNPAEFEAYLSQFPNGVFRALAEARLAALRSPGVAAPGVGSGVGGPGSPATARPSVGASAPVSGLASAGESPRRPGDVFRECAECPEMVVMADGRLALGRYEVTVGEYRAFASAPGGGAGGRCYGVRADSWRDPGFPQTDRHPVTCVSWDDAQAYVSWLSRRTGAAYRLPSEAEWERASAGSQAGCYADRTGNRGTCPAGSYGSNAAGLSDMVGNLWEWMSDCWEGNCGRRVVRGGSWRGDAEDLRPGARDWVTAGNRNADRGFRVSRTPRTGAGAVMAAPGERGSVQGRS